MFFRRGVSVVCSLGLAIAGAMAVPAQRDQRCPAMPVADHHAQTVELIAIATGRAASDPPAQMITPGSGTSAEIDLQLVLRAPERRVRMLPGRLRNLAVDGATRSRTFAALLLALQRGDVIVHVHDSPYPLAAIPAQLVIGSRVGDFRFVRIQIGNRPLGDELTALVGHELFHALEIAQMPGIAAQGIRTLLRRIGHTTDREQHFDTDAAREIEGRIRRELAEC